MSGHILNGAEAIGLDILNSLTSGCATRHVDVACPLCSPGRSLRSQRRRVLRVWHIEPGFATYYCARCGEAGYAHDRLAMAPDRERLAKARAEAAELDRVHKAQRLDKARWLWSQRRPITGSIAQRYLREKRGIKCALPATLGFLPAKGEHAPAMIAAFGMAYEVEPGVIAIADAKVRGVHLTRLLRDGSDRERGEGGKIMIGHSAGWPIVLAPPNDLLGLAITEGIEDALSVHEDTGLGTWAAGSASRMPALADKVPNWIDCVTIVAGDDVDGRRHAEALVKAIRAQNIEVVVPPVGAWGRKAA